MGDRISPSLGVFVFKHTGVFLPGFSAVIAPDVETAKSIMLETLKHSGFTSHTPDYSIELVGALDADKPGLIAIWNGDY